MALLEARSRPGPEPDDTTAMAGRLVVRRVGHRSRKGIPDSGADIGEPVSAVLPVDLLAHLLLLLIVDPSSELPDLLLELLSGLPFLLSWIASVYLIG